MIVVGLTGSIGMGKSTAAAAFARHGAALWDADRAVHRLLAPGGAAVAIIADRFAGVLATTPAGEPYVDRQALGAAVFGDPAALSRLEGILHPLVRHEERAFLLAAKLRRTRFVVLDIPLLFETGGEARCDATVVVSAPWFIQRQRVLGRPGMTPEKLAGILERQMSDWEKRRRADYVVQTGLDRALSRRTVAHIVEDLRARPARCWPRCWPAATMGSDKEAQPGNA